MSFLSAFKQNSESQHNKPSNVMTESYSESEDTETDAKTKLWETLLTMTVGAQKPIYELVGKRITKEGYYVNSKNNYQAFLRIKTYDLYHMNDRELERLITDFQTFNRMYTEPYKLISMMYPTETKRQQVFQQKLIKRYVSQLENGVTERQRVNIENKLRITHQEYRKMCWVEEELKDLTYLMVVYGKTETEVKERIRSAQRVLKRYFALDHIKDMKKIENILKSLNNMNSEI